MAINKKILSVILFIFCLIPLSVNASDYYGVISGADIRIRKNVDSTSYYKFASSGEIFDMPDNELIEGNKACPNGWYKVNYDNNIGYVCSNYLKVYQINTSLDNAEVTPGNECEVAMQQAGFPSSYWNGLCTIKAAHPNWTFTAKATDSSGSTIDWNMSVQAEASCGKNTISSNDTTMIDASCTKATDLGYYNVSEKAVRYYMDPRNFLNEVNIFMFERQDSNFNISYDSYETVSSKIFGSSFLLQQIPDLPNYIRKASETTGVNSAAISTRIKQELGSAKLTSGVYSGQLYSCVSGNYTTRYPDKLYNGNSLDNYYNFFNINATDGSNVTEKALIYAYTHNWGGTGNQNDDRITAIIGGTNFLKNRYINVGQNTIYFQKFNIFPNTTSSRYINQYMTNISAPQSESKISYDAYRDTGLLESNFEFIIPVFSGMDGGSVLVENDSFDNNNNAEITIENNEVPKPSVDSIVNNSGFRYSDGYITNINIGTKVNDVKNTLQAIAGEDNVTITNADGVEIDGNIATGYRININGATNETLIVIIYGDVSGDGEINALDLLKIQKQILGTTQLNGSFKEAADPSKDGNINALDLLKVQKHILGSGNIEQ